MANEGEGEGLACVANYGGGKGKRLTRDFTQLISRRREKPLHERNNVALQFVCGATFGLLEEKEEEEEMEVHIQSGASGCEKGFVKFFLKVPLAYRVEQKKGR